MKGPALLSSPLYPTILPTKPSLATIRDYHIIPMLSFNRFTFKAQLTSLYIYPTDLLAISTMKIKTFSHQLHHKWSLFSLNCTKSQKSHDLYKVPLPQPKTTERHLR